MKKTISLFIALALSASMIAGCTSSSTPQGGTSTSSSTEEEITTLTWYMSLNPVAEDTDLVIEELNKYTRDKIGVEIDYKVLANPDYKEKMPNIINSGEYFDICFTANWTANYLQFVGKDAFLDIKDLLPEYASETYEFIPEAMWKAVTVDGGIYGIPSYKEMGVQGGFIVNKDMADEYGIDLTQVKTIQDYTEVLATVKEKSDEKGVEVIGLGHVNSLGWQLVKPIASVGDSLNMVGAVKIPELGLFDEYDELEVFNQYASEDYKEYTTLMYEWNQAGYLGGDPVQYATDIANRDNDMKNGKLFSYYYQHAPGADIALQETYGINIEYIPLTQPVFKTASGTGGILAISSASEHPDKALEFLNLLNTDEYVGTLIRHGIEGIHHEPVGEDQVDKTFGGTLTENGYDDYTHGWQFGTVFNQKWDVSYPDDIEQIMLDFNATAIESPYVGFSFDTSEAGPYLTSLRNVIAEYSPSLEAGMVDPEIYIPEFLDELEKNGADELIAEINAQLADFE